MRKKITDEEKRKCRDEIKLSRRVFFVINVGFGYWIMASESSNKL